jgi:hypothetical protein
VVLVDQGTPLAKSHLVLVRDVTDSSFEGRSIAVTELPSIPASIADSAEIVHGSYESAKRSLAIAVSKHAPNVLDMLEYNGRTWNDHRLMAPSDFPSQSPVDWVQLGSVVHYMKWPLELWAIDLRSPGIKTVRLHYSAPYRSRSDSIERLSGRLFQARESLYVLTNRRFALYQVANDRLFPVLDLRVPTDTGPLAAREIVDFDGQVALLDGAVRLVRNESH